MARRLDSYALSSSTDDDSLPVGPQPVAAPAAPPTAPFGSVPDLLAKSRVFGRREFRRSKASGLSAQPQRTGFLPVALAPDPALAAAPAPAPAGPSSLAPLALPTSTAPVVSALSSLVIGMNGFVPLHREPQSQIAAHRRDQQDLTQQISLAEEGIEGGAGF